MPREAEWVSTEGAEKFLNNKLRKKTAGCRTRIAQGEWAARWLLVCRSACESDELVAAACGGNWRHWVEIISSFFQQMLVASHIPFSCRPNVSVFLQGALTGSSPRSLLRTQIALVFPLFSPSLTGQDSNCCARGAQCIQRLCPPQLAAP